MLIFQFKLHLTIKKYADLSSYCISQSLMYNYWVISSAWRLIWNWRLSHIISSFYHHHIFSNVQCERPLNVINIAKVAKVGLRNLEHPGFTSSQAAENVSVNHVIPEKWWHMINKGYANYILAKHINLMKIVVKSVPKLLNDNQKQNLTFCVQGPAWSGQK
jgi:hypothetical protein